MEKKVNRINVYLTNQDRKKLSELKEKYHLSYSTIADIIVETLIMACNLREINRYLYNDTTKFKTSIKPKNAKLYDKRTLIYTNGIKIFTRDEIEKYIIDKRILNKVKNQIYTLFQKTYDPNWNGNEWQRRMPKLLKQNKDYYMRILKGEK